MNWKFLFFYFLLANLTISLSFSAVSFDTEKDSVFCNEISQKLNNHLNSVAPLKVEGDSVIKDTTNAKLKATVSEYAAKARALHAYVKTANKMVKELDLTRAYDFPIGISKTLGGMEYMIVIESIMFTPQGGLLTAYMYLELPNGKSIAFRGVDIKISSGGISGLGRLELAEDVPIKLSEQMLLNIKQDGGKTFVRFDCGGFKDMGIGAELEFSRDLIIPENFDGSLSQGTERVKAGFEIQGMSEWGDIVTKINLPPFQIRGLNGFGFYVRDATFDFSEVTKLADVTFPPNYVSANPDVNTPYWQGVYIKDVSVRLPKQFESSEQRRTEFGASDLIIDDMGFTGNLRALNILGIDKGHIGTWAFSIDSIGIAVQANQIIGGGIGGRMLVPVFDKEDPLGYKALINTGGNYLFNVTMTGEKSVPLWMAKLDIHPGSSVEVLITEEKFFPKVILHGNLSVGAGKDTDVSLANISFQSLEIQTIKPYIKVGAFSLSSEKSQQKMSNFPITLNEIGLKTRNNDVGIILEIAVNLVGDSDGGFAATGNFTIWGEQKEEENSKVSYKFKSVELNSLKVDIDGGAFKLKGQIISYREHPTYGKGFKGQIEATFTPGLMVAATVQFGNKGFRYWYVDALVILPSGIPVAPAFGLYGFGGGAYYKMKQVNPAKGVSLPEDEMNNPLDTTNLAGKSLSGIIYIPDEGMGLGLKATVVIGTIPSPKPFNGDATFEIAFNSGGGINFIAFSGNAYFMTDMDKRSADAPIYANLRIDYEVPSKILFGNINVHLNIVNAIKGNGTDNKAGSAIMYFSPSDWFIHIGTPDERVDVTIMNIVQATSYFMVGTTMPPMPAPPSNITEILGGDFNFMRDENALGNGRGFCFGASIFVNTGDLTFLVFYARLEAGGGFDLMLKDYGSGVVCEGRSKPLGINGWYASGQAYAYIQGKIGIKVDLGVVKGDYEILSLGAAVILQAKLPNPFWMRGTIGGYYSILGGLVKGKCRFDATIGEQCQMGGGGSLVANIKVISETSPAVGSKDVSVFNAPQAAFNMEIGKVFELIEMDDTKKTFRIVLDHFKLLEGSKEIPLTHKWNSFNDVLAVQSIDVLPPNKLIKLSVKVHFEELQNGAWVPIISNGKVVEEIKESTFETGPAPNNIPHSNVAYSYPLIDQQNFYKREYNQGYIQLKQGQDYLFEQTNEYTQKARYESAGGKIDFDFSYNTSSNRIAFNIPEGANTNTEYKFTLVNIPLNVTALVDKNVSTVSDNKLNEEDVSVNISRKEIDGDLDLLQENSVYEALFRTSKYNTLAQKLNAAKISHAWSRPVFTGVDEIGLNITGDELFDKLETEGGNGANPLIQYEVSLDNRWFNREINPLIYKGYPVDNMVIDWRNPDSLGVPPIGAAWLGNKSIDKETVKQDFYGAAPDINYDYTEVVYSFPFFCYQDLQNLKLKAAINYSRSMDNGYYNLINSPFVNIKPGQYKLKIKYVLPGTTNVTSEKEVTFINP